VLRVGYGMILLAGSCLVGYVGYHVVRALLAARGIPTFFKALILLVAAGVVVTLIGLIRERRREEKDASFDDGDD